MDAIVTRQLCKCYGSTEVLHGVDLCVPTGGLYGFLGPNGAGKSTTIRILMGLLRASAGRVEVLGRDAWSDGAALRRSVGYLPGELSLYPTTTGRALLAFFDAARGGGCAAEIRRLATRFDMDLAKPIRHCSRGMKQKIGLIQALMHRPDLLILDEPTITLDPLMRDVLHDELRATVADGRTVMFSSHTLSEVDQLCDWVGIVRGGRLIEQNRIATLRARAVRRVEIVLGARGAPAEWPGSLRVAHHHDGHVIGSWVGNVADLLAWLHHLAPTDVVVAPPDLEDLFLAYYAEPQ